MLQTILIIFVVTVLIGATDIYGDYCREKDEIKELIENDYKALIRECKRDSNVLNWVMTLNRRFEDFVESKEYQTRKPYDKFKLTIPTKKYCGIIAFIAVDKDLNLKFVVNFEPSAHDGGRTNKYLKYCVGYGKELDGLIEKCRNTVMNHNLENKRIKTIEDIINK